MAPVAIDTDFYMVLEVTETATAEMITKSYKRLALLLHPDRNKKDNATEKFQLLGRAYETLKDIDKRRNYDLLYPQIKRTSKGCPEPASQTSHSASSANKPKQEDKSSETTQILASRKAKQERAVTWSKTQKVYDDAISSLNKEIQKLKDAIMVLQEIEKAEAAEEASAKSWTTWIFSPIYQKPKPTETEEEKESKARERLQRLHNKSFKEADLLKKESKLKDHELQLRTKRQEFDCLNRKDETIIFMAEDRMRARREWEQQEKDRVAREAQERIWKEYREKERREREAEAAKVEKERRERYAKEAAERRKKQEAEEAARKKLEEEMRARWTDMGKKQGASLNPGYARSKPAKDTCSHGGWWEKVEGRMSCEECSVSRYSYLLQCPSCKMRACAACQQQLRPPKRNMRRGRSSSEAHYSDYFD